MVTCTGSGDSGDHCCYIDGEVCEFLDTDSVRCTVWDEMPSRRWMRAPVGQWFSRTYPGYDCKDWPQNIPDVRGGLCCWEGKL